MYFSGRGLKANPELAIHQLDLKDFYDFFPLLLIFHIFSPDFSLLNLTPLPKKWAIKKISAYIRVQTLV